MKYLIPAAALTLSLGLAAPLFAEGLGFEPVAPEGLDAKAGEMVKALQDGMPGQLPAFEAQGYGYYGALAVPMGVALKPELLSSVANLDSREAAAAGVLDACKAQTGYDCTVVGYLVPAGG
ncbi:MAG: hypothetical protein R3D59_16830 [Paracoccaceae bacterium]|nr:hypothetical protein [Maritimibacter sp.]